MSGNKKIFTTEKFRSIARATRLAETLGRDCGRFFKLAQRLDTVTGCPYLIYSLSQTKDGYRLEYLDVRFEKEGVDLTDTLKRFGSDGFPSSYGLIGYDTEYEIRDNGGGHLMLSHQLAFWVRGVRFGLVISTDMRFTDTLFLELLEHIITRLTGTAVKTWHIFAHFSLAEGSWLDNREENQLKHRGVSSWKNTRHIQRDKKTWLGDVVLIQHERKRKDGKPYKTPQYDRVRVFFGDTLSLYPGTLENVAAGLGFKKGDPHGDISKMSKVKRENFEEFCRYGARDAILCTAIPLDIHSRFYCLGLDFKPRTAAYSEAFFKSFFSKHYCEHGKDWRQLLGQVYGYTSDKPYQHWTPGKIQKRCLEQWYHGGRNEVHRVGCFGEAFYHDLTSAYPSAVIMMSSDYDFGRSHHYWGSEAEREITRLQKRGPFQPHAVTLFCRFKSDAVPVFPAKVDGAVIFPQIFHGTVTWPEYWTAVELDLLEECTVIELVAFDTLDGRHLPKKIAELLRKRKTDKLLYKNLLNYQYGKTVQGVSGSVPFSSISCPALGAYMTGFCRASVGELANLNKDYYGITTDGFISPHEHLKTGAFNRPVTERLKKLGYDWIGIDAYGSESFFIKTRGYALWDEESEKGKIAAMGVQARQDVTSLIKQLRAGTAVKSQWASFSTLEPGEIATRQTSKMTINTTFDMKHIPLPDTIEETGIFMDGEFIALASFETRPLRDVYEYEHLRSLARLKNDEKFEELERRGLSPSEISDVLTAYTLEQPQARRLMWAIRHGLTAHVKQSETTLTEKQWKAFRRIRPYALDIDRERFKEYRWLFRHELGCIKDKKTQQDLRSSLFKKIQETLPQPKKSGLIRQPVTGTAWRLQPFQAGRLTMPAGSDLSYRRLPTTGCPV